MLKLPKGLKKKKKGKKSKKDQELFTEEELEQYRREHQNQSALNSAAPSDSEDAPVAGENDEEWSKFTALTSGVDSVLKKTQGDLDRIKSTSFFQKVPTKLEQETRERQERERREQQQREQEAAAAKVDEQQRVAQELINAVVELSESEPNSEAEEDIFDTGYTDAIASGELPIAYIPESPVLESFEGPDPFDTSYADKVIKGPEVSKRGKKLVSIGSAVQVLTGRVESVGTGSIKSRRQRRGPQNLLLESFDEGDQQQQLQNEELVDGKEAAPQAEEKPQNLSLLDDSADLPVDVAIDLSVSLHLSLRRQQQDAAAEEKEPPAAATDAEEFNLDEFDDLKLRQPVLAEGDDFELLTEQPEAPKKPSRPPPPNLPVVDLEQCDEPEVDDPFDTGFVEKLLPATAVEDDEFDPRAEEEGTEPGETAARADDSGQTADLFLAEDGGASLRVCQVPEAPAKDLLSGSSSDLVGLGHTPLECVSSARPSVAAAGPGTSTFDPFDTSAVDFIVAPGKTELKFLEEELLTADRGLSHSLSDPDFDPRADSEQAAAVQEDARLEEDFQSLAQRKSSLSLHINGAAANRSKSVVFAVVTPDLLKIDGEHALAKKPLTPYYNREPSVPDVEADPFDTSFVPPVEPTKLELTLLEQELTKSELRHSLSDPEFDPRAPLEGAEPELASSDLLGVSEQHDQKVLTPARTDHGSGAISASTAAAAAAAAAVEIDPFDTSIAVNLQPGRAELKLLEDELIPATTARDEGLLSDFLSGGAQEASAVFVKVLTPQPSGGSIDLSEPEVDPFDTSFAENLGPGKTEIKLLEDELIDN